MSDDKKAPEGAEKPEGGKSKLLLLLVVLNVLGVVGAGVAIFFALTHTGTAAAAEAHPVEEANEIGPLIEVPSLIVNLTDAQGTHFLRAGFNLEVRALEQQPEVEERMVPIRSAILLHLSGLGVADTRGRDQRQALLDALTALVNEVIGGDHIRHIYLTEFVVQ